MSVVPNVALNNCFITANLGSSNEVTGLPKTNSSKAADVMLQILGRLGKTDDKDTKEGNSRSAVTKTDDEHNKQTTETASSGKQTEPAKETENGEEKLEGEQSVGTASVGTQTEPAKETENGEKKQTMETASVDKQTEPALETKNGEKKPGAKQKKQSKAAKSAKETKRQKRKPAAKQKKQPTADKRTGRVRKKKQTHERKGGLRNKEMINRWLEAWFEYFKDTAFGSNNVIALKNHAEPRPAFIDPEADYPPTHKRSRSPTSKMNFHKLRELKCRRRMCKKTMHKKPSC